MALPAGITPKTITLGIPTKFNGSPASGSATLTGPVNLVHTPTGTPLFSGKLVKQFSGLTEISFTDLTPTDAAGLNRTDWTYTLEVRINGAVEQPEPITFPIPSAGPDTIDADLLVSVPGSAGTPVYAQAVLSIAGLSGALTAAQVVTALDAPLRAAFGSITTEVLAGLPPPSDTYVALNPEPWFTGDIVRNAATGAITSAAMLWPDGTVGTFTADTLSTKFPGTVDAYHVTKGVPTVMTYTQPAVTRDAYGNVTYRPALQNTFPAIPYDFTLDAQLLFDFDGDALGADTTAIASWPSASGVGTAGYTTALSQSTGGAQPLVKANAINGHKAALFDGVDDYLSSGAYAVARAQPVTIMTVAKVATTGATKWLYAGQSSAAGTLELNVTTGGTAQAKAGTGGTVGAASTTFDTWHVFGVVFNGATSKVYRDAKTEIIAGTLTSGDAASAMGATRLGRSTASVYFTGEIARHAAIGRALGSAEMADAMAQLGARYGITIGA